MAILSGDASTHAVMGMPFFFDTLITSLSTHARHVLLIIPFYTCHSGHAFLMGWDGYHPILIKRTPGQTLLVKFFGQNLLVKPSWSNLSGQTLVVQSPGQTLLVKPSKSNSIGQTFLAKTSWTNKTPYLGYGD